ncbi:MAG: hypothetical protein ACTSRS_09275 [Candidatus Helarchaeota archaeon]
MQIGIQEIAFLIITILFGILIGLFAIQTIKRQRSARTLVASLFFGLLASIFAICSYFSESTLSNIFQALQINLFGLQIFFFFLFLEHLQSKDVNVWRLSLMLGLLLLQTFGLWTRILFPNVGSIHHTLWFFSDMGYTIAGWLVYLVFSVPIYLRTYQYTSEKKPLIIAIALGLVGVGFVFSFLADLFDFLSISVSWLGPMADYTMVIQALGLFIFTIIYLIDIDYLYRLPNDVFLLMVVTKSGIPLHTVKLKTRTAVEIQTDLLSGLLSAINNVFEELFQSKGYIKNISSEEIHLLMESGENTIAVVITDRISYFLDQALKRYIKEFEVKFKEEIDKKSQNLTDYQMAIDLIKPVFPFFIVDKVIM